MSGPLQADAVNSGDSDGKAAQWPEKFAGALQGVPKGASVRSNAESLFTALLHPDSARRANADKALQHRFLRQY